MDKLPNLNRKLVLETQTRVADGAGGYEYQWDTLGVLWAEVSPSFASETPGVGGDVSSLGYKIVTRGAEIGSSMRPRPDQRFVEGSRIYKILSVSELDQFGRFLLCLTKREELS